MPDSPNDVLPPTEIRTHQIGQRSARDLAATEETCMKAKPNVPCLVVFILLVVAVGSPLQSYAQCYLSQGCAPQDDLTYAPNGTGQVYHGDGGSSNFAGGWTTNYSDVNQCLSCHYGTDTLPYLMTGHKNTLRKIAPNVLWGGPDSSLYPATDAYYGSGSTFNWTTGQVTLGWCDPLSTPALNGLVANDPACLYPYYTLPNENAPAPYTPVAPTIQAGGVRNLYYLYGGWTNYGGNSNPAGTHLNSVFDTGFTGDVYPNGNFDCARCHATGYNFDNSAPEPTENTNNKLAAIRDAQFKRVPSDGFVAPGTTGTSSWFLTGIQCERCHIAAYSYGSHPWDPITVTQPQNEAATALCMECHRGENIVPANPNGNPPSAGSITPANGLVTSDHGYCSDLSASAYSTCVSNPSNQWIYKPYVNHEAGQAFLNGSHGRFTGNLIQNAQHTSDLSITISGTYGSQFSENLSDPTRNFGCTGCHDPHQSTVAGTNPPQPPIVKTCDKCHALAKTILSTTIHPAGPGTPFPTGTQADIPGACITCHMQAASRTRQQPSLPHQCQRQLQNVPYSRPTLQSGNHRPRYCSGIFRDERCSLSQCKLARRGSGLRSMPRRKRRRHQRIRLDDAARHAWRPRLYPRSVGVLGIRDAPTGPGSADSDLLAHSDDISLANPRNDHRLAEHRGDLLHDGRIDANNEFAGVFVTDFDLEHDDTPSHGRFFRLAQ